MIPGQENASAPFPESQDSIGILSSEAVAPIKGKEPKLIEIGIVETREHGVGSPECFPISSRDLEARVHLPDCGQMLPKKQQTIDRPVVGGFRNRGLYEDPEPSWHPILPPL